MALEITTIQSIEDIKSNITAIAAKIDPEHHHKLDNIRRELEYELGFSQVDHLRTSETLEDFTGLTIEQINDATQRGIESPDEIYPKEVSEHVKSITQQKSQKPDPLSKPVQNNQPQPQPQKTPNERLRKYRKLNRN